jgi:hypothetical protein
MTTMPTPDAPTPLAHCRVAAASVADFLERYYLRDRYHGRGADYAAAVLASHERDFEAHGYDIISRHESVTGSVVALFSEPAQLALRLDL